MKALFLTYGEICSSRLMAIVSNPESSEEQLAHSRLLVNVLVTVQSVQQSDGDPSENLENKTVNAYATQLNSMQLTWPIPN